MIFFFGKYLKKQLDKVLELFNTQTISMFVYDFFYLGMYFFYLFIKISFIMAFDYLTYLNYYWYG